jgi:competence protein ComFA
MLEFTQVIRVRCEKCGNKIKELFIYRNNQYICRRCLVFKEKEISKEYFHGNGNYKLNYSLTSDQEMASEFILKEFKEKKNCILSAVTGAGKTEIIYKTISYCVNNNLKIGIVIPRKDVVIELYQRISNDFKEANVISVYGGNSEKLYGDIIILTSHQLYRYKEYFDLVIIDEVDAFPFYKNELLNCFLNRSIRGNIVYMSATIPKELLKLNLDIFYLNRRYHGEKLDVPKVKYFWSKYTIKKFLKDNKECINIIYFPTIKLQTKFASKLKIEHYLINSKTHNRKEMLEILHSKKSAVILSTLVLERGVTFKNTNVIVYLADHPLFNYENLVQISGRVGRNYLYPHGKIIFLVNNKNKKVREAIKFIKKCNE